MISDILFEMVETLVDTDGSEKDVINQTVSEVKEFFDDPNNDNVYDPELKARIDNFVTDANAIAQEENPDYSVFFEKTTALALDAAKIPD